MNLADMTIELTKEEVNGYILDFLNSDEGRQKVIQIITEDFKSNGELDIAEVLKGMAKEMVKLSKTIDGMKPGEAILKGLKTGHISRTEFRNALGTY